MTFGGISLHSHYDYLPVVPFVLHGVYSADIKNTMNVRLLLKRKGSKIVIKILEMDEKLRNNLEFRSTNDFLICSRFYTALGRDNLCLRGKFTDKDNEEFIYTAFTEEFAKHLINRMKKALKECFHES